jgi:uncharacterized protein (TIGR00645 family)
MTYELVKACGKRYRRSMALSQKPLLERQLELWMFRARWLMAPFYVGLVIALGALLVVFVGELIHELGALPSMDAGKAIVMALSLIDLSLAGNLLLIVIFSGYENFVSKIDTGDDEDRPDWMGTIDFGGLKMKLMASIVAISAVALLRAFLQIGQGVDVPDRTMAWLIGIHLTFVVSGVMLAVMDMLVSRSGRH